MEPDPDRCGRDGSCRTSRTGRPQIMRLYGRGFQQGWLVLILSAATAVISCINGIVGTAILSAGSVWLV